MTQPTPWSNQASHVQSASRVDELDAIIADLTDALTPENLMRTHAGTPDWARKGVSVTHPGKSAFVQPSLYSNWQYQDVLQNQLRAASHERPIAEAAAALFAPYQPNAPAVPSGKLPRPRVTPGAAGASATVMGLLTELLGYHGPLNSGEQEQLDKIHGPRPKPPNPEQGSSVVWNLLQQAIGAKRP